MVLLKKNVYNELVKKVNAVDISTFQKAGYDNKIASLGITTALTVVENKMQNITGLATTSALTAVENKITSITGWTTFAILTAVNIQYPMLMINTNK